MQCVVVLDDNITYLTLISGILRSHYDVRTFDSSRKLIDFLSLNSADLLVMSASLKENYSLMVMLNVSDRWPDLPIVMTTDCSMQYLRFSTSYREMTKDVVWMPVETQQFLTIIGQALGDPVVTSDS